MRRDVYISEYVDAARVREYAREKAAEGDKVTIHLHAYDKGCFGRPHEIEDGDASSS